MAENTVSLGKMTAAQASDLERRMQTEDPATIILPGGKTLKEVQDEAAKRAVDDEVQKQAARDAEAKRTAEQAPPLPDVEVTLTPDGSLVTAPVSTGEEKEKPAPAPAKPVTAPAPAGKTE